MSLNIEEEILKKYLGCPSPQSPQPVADTDVMCKQINEFPFNFVKKR